MEEVVILAGCRTPIGKFLGALSSLSAVELGGMVIHEARQRSGAAANLVDEVIMGNVLSAGLGQAPARQAALKGGLPPTVAALTINKVCGSGLKAVMLAAQAIRAGDAKLVIAGGMESMSRAPFLLENGRTGFKFGDQSLKDHMLLDGLTCAFEHCSMGQHAEHTSRSCSVNRHDQDEFAAESQRRAAAAIASGAFRQEILPVTVRAGKQISTITDDEGPRPESTYDALAKLRPAFDGNGTVTAGNSSMLSDGAAAVVVASRAAAAPLSAKPMARVVAYATYGVPPKELFIAPVGAIRQALARAELAIEQIDLVELNEAFAAQTVACMKELGLRADRVNVHGGAIALGHPLGASGARVLVTLLHALEQRDGRFGVAALCLGGGNAIALVVERLTG